MVEKAVPIFGYQEQPGRSDVICLQDEVINLKSKRHQWLICRKSEYRPYSRLSSIRYVYIIYFSTGVREGHFRLSGRQKRV